MGIWWPSASAASEARWQRRKRRKRRGTGRGAGAGGVTRVRAEVLQEECRLLRVILRR